MDAAPAPSLTEPADRSGFRDPVFLLSPPRSYSTVTIALLAGHPQLYGLPETYLFVEPTIGDTRNGNAGQKGDQVPDLPMGLVRAIAQLHEGRQDAASIARAIEWIQSRQGTPSRTIMDHLLRLIYPRIAVEKSPKTVASTEALTRCMQSYPGARYLHLTRHPVSTQRSMNEHFKNAFPTDMPEQERVRWCLRSWYSSHLRIVQAMRCLPRHRWMRVRAEDLIRDPKAWLPRVLDWLGLEGDEMILDRMLETQKWEFAGWGGDIGHGGADPKFLRNPKLCPVPPPAHDVIDPEWEISDEIRVRIGTLARHLGY